jgi:ribosomal protein L11 methyltransferase
MVAGGEPELALLLELFPRGVEEVDGGFAVYTDEAGERALRERFDATSDPVAEGWEERWREFHHGVVVGRFWVGPPWEEPPAGIETIVIDPGRAFGTGAHPTTRMTLELLQEIAPTSLLDVGCGSGVLAIAAAKLGFTPVVGIDTDEAAIEATLANAGVNGVELAALPGDALVDDLPTAGVAVANVALDVVERLLPRVPAAVVVASGYPERDEPRAEGWRRIDRRTAGGWAADLFARSV